MRLGMTAYISIAGLCRLIPIEMYNLSKPLVQIQ